MLESIKMRSKTRFRLTGVSAHEMESLNRLDCSRSAEGRCGSVRSAGLASIRKRHRNCIESNKNALFHRPKAHKNESFPAFVCPTSNNGQKSFLGGLVSPFIEILMFLLIRRSFGETLISLSLLSGPGRSDKALYSVSYFVICE